MKIRGRLITAFLIMTIFPVILMLICVTAILNNQYDILTDSYNIKKSSYDSSDIILNPTGLFYNISRTDYEILNQLISTDPQKLLDNAFLESSNKNLEKRDTFLIVVKEKKYYYIGNQKIFQKMSSLPLYNTYDKKTSRLTFIDQNTSSIIKSCTFYFTDSTLGQVFLVTDFSMMLPRLEHSVIEIIIAFFSILLITGLLLSLWIYRSILRPLSILRLATTQIGNGNLSQPIPLTSQDEIGQLCKDFEEMRIRLQKMIAEQIQSEEETREIISSISHDLKTPVTAIKGYTEGILDGVADTREKQTKYLQTIYNKANDITYLIDELAVFSKVERNFLAYNFIAVNLENYFSDCIEDISLDLESKNMAVEYYNTTDKDTLVLVDTEQLKRVLNNIIENAAKYNDKPTGHIYIRIEDVPIPPVTPPLYRQLKEDGTDLIPRKAPEEFVQIQIEDDGPGIAAEDLTHIFDRFFRADMSRNSSKRGSGLGLAIVKKIISDHGGNVWAESIEGVGTSFYFTLKKTS